jgi:serine phosphatase RsbU (regulator of sigma subunit)
VVVESVSAEDEVLTDDALGRLHEVGRALVSELDLRIVVQAVVDAARPMTGAAFGAFFYDVVDATGDSSVRFALSGAPRSAFDGLPLPHRTEVVAPPGEGSVRHDDITEVPAHGRTRSHLGLLPATLPARSCLAAPVTAGPDEVIGYLLLGHPEPGRFAHRDELVLQGIADYASIAVSNAREHRAQTEIAHTLQRALLPAVGFLEGVEVAVRYHPAARQAKVGGDWYDVLPLADGRLSLTVGDVAGHNVIAAARMGTVRNSLSVHALRELDPGRALLLLDEHLRLTNQPGFVTVVHAVFDRATATVDVARAGHLPPLVVPAHGAPHYLDGDPAPPIGVGLLRGAPPTVRVELGLEDTMVFFTDGLVERRRTATDVMMARMRDFVRDLGPTSAEELCDRILAEFIGSSGGDDDVAMLAIRPLFHVPPPGYATGGADR